MTKPHAIVTGAAGFVGSHLVDRLLDDGYRVTGLDNLSSGRATNVAHLSDDDAFGLLERDITEPLPEFDTVDTVYHFASRASPVDFESHPIDIAMTNSLGAHNVFELAVETDATVVLASTSEVYGDPERHPQSEAYNGNVDPRGPRAPYDEGKRFAEALATAYRTEHDLDVRTLRIFNTYGPRMRLDDGRVMPTFLKQALRGDDLTVHGDGSQTRSFCYVSDLIEGVVRLGTREGLDGVVVNVGSTDEVSIRTLAETILELIDTESELTFEPRPVDDPDLRRPDIDRAQEVLGWSPSVSLEDGLVRMLDDFRDRIDE
ncbi:NAD-dependent epimerase/dehydratase family protein [Halorientalis pallida]|uniref:NAD-dependent epimerase/dehydratase family protein n=1 Tax=Halorientalis pallida TaxID=2479928 RepID=UPI003C704207